MRLQLRLVVSVVIASVGIAHADGTLSMRGVYYKERSTRVEQPMLDGMFEVGAHGLLDAHLLVDAITSASSGSGAANATPFTEHRYEAGGSYAHELPGPISLVDKLRVGGDAKFSTESDYRSIYAGARAEADLAQKNATVGIGGGIGHDNVDNAGVPLAFGTRPPLICDPSSKATSTECTLDSYSGFASASQIVGRNAVIGATYDVAELDGFQSNAYRQVITSTGFVAERHPNTRFRQAIAVSARYHVPASQTTFIAAYRYYRDSWHIHAHTPELRIVQQVGSTADAAIRYRYYHQTAAVFYEPRYGDPMAIAYLSDDPKMSAFDGHTLEAKLGVFGKTFDLGGRWSGARFEGILEYIIQHNRFGNAVVAHVALTVPFDY